MLGHNLTQELLTDIHAGFPNHRLTSGRGLHFLDRRGHTKAWVPDVGDLDPDPAARSSTVPWRPADHGPTVLSCDWGKHHTTGMNPAAARLNQLQGENAHVLAQPA